MSGIVNDKSFDIIFRDGRSHGVWLDRPVSEITLQALYELLSLGPTSANGSPGRFLFLCSDEAKERLRPYLSAGNVTQTMTAPAVAIVGYDLAFCDKFETLWPGNEEVRTWFEGNDEKLLETAFRNSTLQGAYMIIAARALGLDCGPMSGFDVDGVNREFFADSTIRVNFLCNLGHGDPAALPPRKPRLAFDDAAKVI
ncbi:MAG: malonic semialdehyde reductase [Rhodospirillaceae bacterium]|jgi:3-hydroxypropanoate dehydrogenase|nr:malonic semialdehyde reductase [Rhodospirillaceae bacterium]MBT3494302.1 malonic semialdehyde reductase [Rhodospirillaceae bacterium]MBT3778618.1 malonic semialdehyde reductase [Rhodospirillaceae bacterium]MBT3979157.1 malonic semialdehyde reductase [Rhodospirillaceae bacterium]MBT4171055.1 malonic semialdehyde reductase [Rhodospirillaceae bacterium]